MTIIIIIDRNWNRLGNRITGQNAGFVSSSSSSSLLSSCLMSSSSCGFNCTIYEGKPSLLWICRSTASSSIQWLSLVRSFIRSFIHKTISLTLESSEIRTLVHLSSQVGGWLMTMMTMMIVLWGEVSWTELSRLVCFFVFFSLPAALLLLLYKESFCSLHQQQQTTTIHPPSSFITKIPILMMVCLPSAMSCLVIEIQVNSPFTSLGIFAMSRSILL